MILQREVFRPDLGTRIEQEAKLMGCGVKRTKITAFVSIAPPADEG